MSLDQISHLPPSQQEAFLNGPALRPPPGVIPNFENPPNRLATAYAGVTICLFATTVAVFVRFYFKVFAIKRVNIEDYLALTALATFYNTVLYEATMMAIKVAILKDWARIFAPRGTRNTTFTWICYVMLGINVVYYIAAILVSSFSCVPHEKIWNRLLPGQCIDAKVVLICSASVNVVSDLLILVLPQKTIWSLRLSTKKKIGISFFFTTGVHACICAIIRLTLAIQYNTSDDSTYYLAGLSLWCLAEMTCAFVVFSAPAAPKVFTSSGMKSTFTDILGSCSTMLTKPSRQVYTHSWPSANPTNPSSKYQKVDENGMPLQPLPPARLASAQPEDHAHVRNLSEVGIVRTTHIETSVNYVDRDRERDMFNYPHAWEGSV
ncbi:hypothetical protein MGN70_002367 [Eutypa lata]|nr:hypothetical protein MGN70_002367 [Eutypa lata]